MEVSLLPKFYLHGHVLPDGDIWPLDSALSSCYRVSLWRVVLIARIRRINEVIASSSWNPGVKVIPIESKDERRDKCTKAVLELKKDHQLRPSCRIYRQTFPGPVYSFL